MIAYNEAETFGNEDASDNNDVVMEALSVGHLILPNGIQQSDGTWTKSVILDEMTGNEEDILTDKRMAPGGKGKFLLSSAVRMTQILSRCTVAIGSDQRPEGKNRFNAPAYFEETWKNAFLNDRGFALIRLRQLSLGDEFKFKQTCPNCNKEIPNIVVDLSKLDVKSSPLDVVSRPIHTFKLSDGREVTWTMMRGYNEAMMTAVQEERKEDFATALMQMRVKTIGDQKATPMLLRSLRVKDRQALNKEFDTVESGIDTRAEITCDGCRHNFSRKINVGSMDFFFPSGLS